MTSAAAALSSAAAIEVIVFMDDLSRYDPQATYGAIALEYDTARQYYWAFSTAHLLQLAGIKPGMMLSLIHI